MEPPGYTAGGTPSPTRKQLQGPRPTQLRVSKDSHSIKKPPLGRQQHLHPAAASRPPPPNTAEPDRQPVIIYAVSPKVIHTTTDDFMSIVQRLTGTYSNTTSDMSMSMSTGGDISPAARLASIERTSPKERDIYREPRFDLMFIDEELQMGRFPGILSPAPGTLPPVSPGLFFSPGSDPYGFSLLQDLSPPAFGNSYQNIFMPSPSNLFSAPLVSPSPSGFGLFDPQFF